MKKYEIISNMDNETSIVTSVAYIGTTADIKALCKSIRRARNCKYADSRLCVKSVSIKQP